jgi:hypothetical protein
MKKETQKKVITALIVIAVAAGLMLSAHVLVNYFNIVEVIKAMHGG